MKSSTLILYSSMAFLFSIPAFSGAGKEIGMAYPVQYQGGSLPFKQSHAVSAVLANSEVVFIQHGQRFVVPVPDIREISCGTSVRRRFVLLSFAWFRWWISIRSKTATWP